MRVLKLPEINLDNDDELKLALAIRLFIDLPLKDVYKRQIYNLGNNNPVELTKFIAVLEGCLGKEASKIYLDMQPGDVIMTYADVSDLEKDIGFKPETSIEEGLAKFVEWYRKYYKV